MRTINLHPGRATLRLLLALAVAGAIGLALTAPSSGAERRPVAAHRTDPPTATLNSVGSRYVGARIPIKGYSWGASSGKHRLVLQRFSTKKHRWVWRASRYARSGMYRFRAQHVWSPGRVRFRTVLYDDGRRVAVSNVIKVQIVAPPAPAPAPQPAQAARAAQPPAGSMLPDLRIKDLTKCGAGDSAATGGTCFMIVPSAPYNADFPQLQGRKLLKFGVVTLNAGAGAAGPAELVAHRATTSDAWQVSQDFYGAGGTFLGSLPDPVAHLSYAGDGHHHWHVSDFDSYDLLDATGTRVARAEKHGYCLEDDTTFGPMEGQPGVSPTPVYSESASCGKDQPDALTVTDGLSRGWGDTYPTSLPDQAIDITGLPDGVYTVRVHADALGAVVESDEGNNVAEVKVQITGDSVTVLPGTSQGGL